MFLTCPKCATRYTLAAKMLAPEGRKVKCMRCAEVWLQRPDPVELFEEMSAELEDDIFQEPPEETPPIPEGSSVPVLRDEEKTPDDSHATAMGFAAATAVFVLVLAGLLMAKSLLVEKFPATAALYSLVGLSVDAPGNGLEFDRVEVFAESGGSMTVEGHILNIKSVAQTVPMIEAVLKNPAGETVDMWYIEPPETHLAAEEIMPFKAVYPGTKHGAESLHLRFVLLQKSRKDAHEEEEHAEAAHEESHEESHTPAADHKEEHKEEAHETDAHAAPAEHHAEPAHH